MDSRSIRQIFPLHTRLSPVVPKWFWTIVQAVAIVIIVVLGVLLIVNPEKGLYVTWRWVVPILPLVFLIAPGMWRNVCPLASLNQLPRRLGWRKTVRIPRLLSRHAYSISVLFLLTAVSLRKSVFGDDGHALAALILVMTVLAILGGFMWAGKSGWCTSFCPVLPVELLYGQSPMLRVLNAHCQPCERCTNNCYDRNPPITNLVDFYRSQWHSRKYSQHFAAIFPGFIAAFYLLPDVPDISAIALYLQIGLYMSISYVVFWLLSSSGFVKKGSLYALFGGIALNLYYWFNAPLLEEALLGNFNDWFAWTLRFIVFFLTILWLIRSSRKEAMYLSAMAPATSPEADTLVPLAVLNNE